MARPSINDLPMTPAERQRRYRARLAAGEVGKAAHVTVKQASMVNGLSQRVVYYARVVKRSGLVDWQGSGVFARGPMQFRAKASLAFVADICRHGDAETQAEMLELIKADPAEARAVWRLAKTELGA